MRLRLRDIAFITFVAFVCTTSPTRAADASPERYAILSLVGDALTIVTYQPSVGSNVNTNLRQTVAIGNDELNRVAETAAERAIQRAVPQAKTITLSMSSDPELTGRSEELIESPERVKALVAPIAAQLGAQTRWMVLVTKHRTEMRLRVSDGVIGSGKLSGLGFFIDREHNMTELDSGATGRGFLAPYAYVTVSLVDLASGTVVRTRNSDESSTVPSARSATSMDPWQALSAEEKMQTLQRLVRRAIDSNLPALLKPT